MNFLCVVFNGSFELLQFPVHETTIRVDYGVGLVQFDGLVEVLNSPVHPATIRIK